MRSDDNLFDGRYLFHLHTSYTDGALTVRQYFEYAALQGIERLIFLEHIRSDPAYDVQAFVTEVEEYSHQFRIPATVGFEAKLLPDGRLDIHERDLRLAGVLGIAEHRFVDDLTTFQEAFKRAVDTYSALLPEQTIVWVHPGLWFKKRALLECRETEYVALLRSALDHGVRVERNLRYDLVPEAIRLSLDPAGVVIGVDAHRLADLHRSASDAADASNRHLPGGGEASSHPGEVRG